jgi:hypothetical protein
MTREIVPQTGAAITQAPAETGAAFYRSAPTGRRNGTATGYPDILTPEVTTGELSPTHRAQLETESAISFEAIAARGYFTQTDKQAIELLGFADYQARTASPATPALVIPLYNWKGERTGYALRPDIPRQTSRGNVVKYETPKAAAPALDIAPLTRDQLADVSKPLIITEGAKKADGVASRGYCAINLSGVYGFRDKNTALPDWENIPLDGRVVYIAYDSDIATKPQVEHAMRRLEAFLQSRGAIVKIVYLPDGENGAKTGLDDFFARGGTVAEMFSYARDLEPIEESKRKRKEAAKAEKLAQFELKGKPVIETYDRPLPDVLTELSQAIAQYNGSTPTLFHGAGGLCEITKNQYGVTILAPVGSERLQVIAAHGATWTVTPADARLPREIAPPATLCQQFIVSREYWRNIPPIKRILTAPFIDRAGHVCQKDGYHASEQVFLTIPDGHSLPDTTPTPANIEAAKVLLNKLLSEVAFADDASRANAFGLLILPFVRLYIDGLGDGQTPIHLFDAPTQSSGKTYAVLICLSPFCEAVPTSDKKKEEESEKEVFSLLIEGAFYIFIDNVKSSLASATLATAVTSGTMRGRVLGASKTETVSSNVVWAATSNNAQLDADVISRSILIALDTNSETPEDREFAFNPVQYIAQNRGEVQAAILTIVRAWLEAGRPERSQKVSRFPAWERVIGGILETAGVSGFLDNHKTARENTDPETNAWSGFIEAWHAAHGESFKTVKELLETPDGDDLKATIGDKDTAKIFGKQLQKRKNKIIRGYKITREDTDGKRRAVNRWRLVPISAQTSTAQNTTGDHEKPAKSPVIGYGTD